MFVCKGESVCAYRRGHKVCRSLCASMSPFASVPVREGETEEKRELPVRVGNRKARKLRGDGAAINRKHATPAQVPQSS